VRKLLSDKDHLRGRTFYCYFAIFWLYTLISAQITSQRILGEMTRTLVAQQIHAWLETTSKENNNSVHLQISMFHRAFFNSIIDKTPTHALLTQHYISLAC
jgi:hypothetical protein